VLLSCAIGGVPSKDRHKVTATPGGVQPCAAGQKGVPLIVPVLLSTIEGISHLRIHLPKDLRTDQARETAWKSVLEVHRRFPDGITLLDPVQNMGIKDEKFKKLVEVSFTPLRSPSLTPYIQKIEAMEDKMYKSPLQGSPRLPELYTSYSKKMEGENRVRGLKKRIQSTQDILQLEELKCRKRVLRRLGFTTSADIVDVKGRVACEISTGDELLLTELIFNGAFNTLAPEHCAALLSCFVFDEKVQYFHPIITER
jgi:ATP-dependent RNA helicase DOB1